VGAAFSRDLMTDNSGINSTPEGGAGSWTRIFTQSAEQLHFKPSK
jgi:hypothetical protein